MAADNQSRGPALGLGVVLVQKDHFGVTRQECFMVLRIHLYAFIAAYYQPTLLGAMGNPLVVRSRRIFEHLLEAYNVNAELLENVRENPVPLVIVEKEGRERGFRIRRLQR